MATREERLSATQKAYEEWAEVTPFTTDTGASDEDEAKLMDTLLDVDPEVDSSRFLTAKGDLTEV